LRLHGHVVPSGDVLQEVWVLGLDRRAASLREQLVSVGQGRIGCGIVVDLDLVSTWCLEWYALELHLDIVLGGPR
jgi:hypothetical protein